MISGKSSFAKKMTHCLLIAHARLDSLVNLEAGAAISIGNKYGRLRMVSNLGDGDCWAGEIHTRARNFEEMRREGSAKK